MTFKTNRRTKKKFKQKNSLHGYQDRYGLHGALQTTAKYAKELDEYWSTPCRGPKCRKCGSCARHCTCSGTRRRPL